jgi:hypothetical protein
MQCRRGSTAVVFEITDGAGVLDTVDLSEEADPVD